MKFLSAAIVAVLTAGVSMTAAAAPAGYVPYKCDNGKKLNVVYEFDRSGNAVGASANAAGKQISLRVDKQHRYNLHQQTRLLYVCRLHRQKHPHHF